MHYILGGLHVEKLSYGCFCVEKQGQRVPSGPLCKKQLGRDRMYLSPDLPEVNTKIGAASLVFGMRWKA